MPKPWRSRIKAMIAGLSIAASKFPSTGRTLILVHARHGNNLHNGDCRA